MSTRKHRHRLLMKTVMMTTMNLLLRLIRMHDLSMKC